MKLLFATTHSGKRAELVDLLAGAVQVASLRDFPDLPEVEETGKTFEENAELKAVAYAQATGLATLADDSGLCVDALDGRPGVLSARYAASDAERVARVLKELHGVPPERRDAHFVCALCLLLPSGQMVLEVGRCEGRIALEPRGDQGFGYDPIFFLPDRDRTMAELTRAEKAKVSHRGAAFRRMMPHLQALAAVGDALPPERR